MSDNEKVAVLVDAENISYQYAKLIIDEASRFGTIICKRIYGDWSNQALSSWIQPIKDYSFNAIQQFSNTKGKNASDSALIIDAMDLLHENKFQCVCIISSDSDFTRIASRLRESEIYVVGMGEQKTPSSFRSACDKFLYLDVLQNEPTKDNSEDEHNEETNSDLTENEEKNGLNKPAIAKAITNIISSGADEDGWIPLADLGRILNQNFSDFDVRNFGHSNLSGFVESFAEFEIRRNPSESNPMQKVVYVRKKPKDQKAGD